MKKFFYLLLIAATATTACRKHQDKINEVKISLFSENAPMAEQAVKIRLASPDGVSVYEAATDAAGTATFHLVAGIYQATATLYKGASVYNGTNAAVTVSDAGPNNFNLEMVKAVSGQVLIKELYNGGCKGNDGKAFHNAKYVILYNNSAAEADLSGMAFAMASPYNSNGKSSFLVDGSLSYKDSIPAQNACWWFQGPVKLAPWHQIVIAIHGAIDNTATHPKSVDLSKADYAMYHPDVFKNAAQYPVPSASIPADHYLMTYNYGAVSMNSWPLSNTSPAFFLFTPEGISAQAYVSDPVNQIDHSTNKSGNCAMIPVKWINDAVEVFRAGYDDSNAKRLLSAVDAGHVTLTNVSGYTLYRNVDKTATEALAENKGKLVYDYAGGTADLENGSTDPSGIDAEASIAKGAHIVYKDTNNSTNDFHQRKVASIKQ